MAQKVISQGVLSVLIFFSSWFALTQVDWVAMFKIEETTDKTEQKLGEILWEHYKRSETEIDDTFITQTIDSIVSKICTDNEIDQEYIKVHIFQDSEVNAFAMPSGHLILNSGLILDAQDHQGLAGVICHEIAHIELNHIMKKLVKEMGLSVLISIATGDRDIEIVSEASQLLFSSAFDRRWEKEADIKAVDYLLKSNIDPEPFANFLYQMSHENGEGNSYLSWVTTHPESKERGEYIIEYSKDAPLNFEPVLTAQTWNQLKKQLQNEE